jgi:hypothetical protein
MKDKDDEQHVQQDRTLTPEGDVTTTTTAAASDDSGSAVTCAICLNDITDLCVVRPCGHEFDEECISEWLSSKYYCPMCRAKVYQMDTNINPDGSCTSRDVRHLREEVHDINPHIKLKFVRHAETSLVQVICDKDGDLIFKAHGHEEKFPVVKGQTMYLLKLFTSDDEYQSFIVFPDETDEDGFDAEHQILIPDPEDSDGEEDESVINDGNGIQDQLAAAITEHLNHMDTLTGLQETLSLPDSDDEELTMKISPSVTLKWLYPNAMLYQMIVTDFVTLTIRSNDAESGAILRPGSVVYLHPVTQTDDMRRDTVTDAGKEYQLSKLFKDLFTRI